MNLRCWILMIFIFAFLFGCGEDKSTTPMKPPHISSIAPTSGKYCETISIIGSNFGNSQLSSFVTFTNKQAIEYSSWCDTIIKVIIPFGATSGNIFVTVNGNISNEIEFILNEIVYGTLKDIDGNIYKTVQIGSQLWMAENLNVCHYLNGDSIPEVRDSSKWINLKTGAWCYYNNDPAMGLIYGKLYNWYAVKDPRGLAPFGWNVADDKDWSILISYLGGESIAGGKMKESGISHWYKPNKGATNESGFCAIPGGYHSFMYSYKKVPFEEIGTRANWWSSTLFCANLARFKIINSTISNIAYSDEQQFLGISVRCLKNR